jgi:DNA invertase Pin-like site-specific DNA recombinase
MTGILGYARVSTGDQDVAGQTMRLTQAGAIKVFTDVRSGMAAHRSAAVLFDRSKLSFNNSRYIFK